jgi:hypothetical protein
LAGSSNSIEIPIMRCSTIGSITERHRRAVLRN